MSSWVKLSRKLATSAIAAKPEYLAVWIHLLLSASYKEGEILVGRQVVRLLPGQLVFGRQKFAEKVGVSESICRSALKVLENLQQITIKSETKFSVITITKWSFYQEASPANDQQVTNKRPTSDHNKEIQELQEEDQKLLAPACADAVTPKKARKAKVVADLVGVDQMVSEGCLLEHARDFLTVRKKKRADLTPTAWAGIVREASKAGIPVGQAVQVSAERGWQSFKASWDWRSENVARQPNTGAGRAPSLSLVDQVRLHNAQKVEPNRAARPGFEKSPELWDPGTPPSGIDWDGEFSAIDANGKIVGAHD
jgi:hypothetical protein